MKKIHCLLIVPLLFAFSLAVAQNKVITGKVTNKDTGEPMQGVNILADKAKGGTATKADGSYSITVDKKTTVLIFSYVGYATQNISIADKAAINVVLSPSITTTDEVVVIGYGTQKKSSVTGAVSKYKNEKLDESPVSRLDQALQGKIAGVQVQNVSSEAGSDPKVQVRGISSINAGQSPLVVVDGHPVPDGLAFVNMSDVESVEVLKDAASAAIYGSRGGSGVILITTKSGRSEKTRYNLKTSWGTKNPYKVYDIMSTSEYTNLLYYEAALRFADTGWKNYATTAQINAKGNLASSAEKAAYLLENGLNGGVATDWQAAALRTAQVKNVELNVSGGNAATKYYISGSYQNDPGMIKHSEYERFNVRSKVNIALSKKMKLNINLNPSLFTRERPSTNFTDFTRVSSYLPLTLNAAQLAFVLQNPANTGLLVGDYAQPRVFNDLPYSGVMPDGTIFTNPVGTAISISSSANNSPYSILQTQKITTKDYRILSSADLTYTIIPGLNFKTLVSTYLDYTTGLDFSKSNSSAAGAPSKGVYVNRTYFDLLNENTFTYNKQIKSHSIEILAGFTAQKTKLENQQITATNFISDNITTLNTALSISQDPTLTYNTVERIGLLSYLGRLNYSFENKYLLSASFRADGSSKFAPGNKWGYFPSISAGWIASKEKFLQDVSWIDNLKFRGSYGAVGNNNIPNYLWLSQLYLANYPTGSGNGTSTQGVAPSNIIQSNPKIKWERTFSYNEGLDLAIFKNAVTIGLDVYQSKTDNMLLQQSAMGITGVPQVINNIGKLQNNGIELELTSNNYRSKNFRWSTSGNISHVNTKLLQLGDETQLLNTGERLDGYLNKVGGPLIQYYGLKTDGIWLSQADVNAAIAKGQTSSLSGYFAPGALKFKDINGDNIIDLNDRTVIGNPYPDFTWGITNNFTFHGFDLSFTFQGVQGGQMMNGDGFYNEARKYNRSFNDNRWISPANPGDGKTPYFTNGYTNAWTQSDYLVTSASYWALREVIGGYTIPVKSMKRLKLSSARLYASLQNVYYHFPKGYVGLNPEARSTAGLYASPLLDGYQRGAFPINRAVLIGLDINF
jgi:TonB-linked SusC/RagA family outer membrane protein